MSKDKLCEKPAFFNAAFNGVLRLCDVSPELFEIFDFWVSRNVLPKLLTAIPH
jgi:hypothetical protein